MLLDIERVLISERQLAERVASLGEQITRDYKGKELLLLSVLKGSVVFMADLMRAIKIPVQIEFMSLSSYGSGTISSGEVKILRDLDRPIDKLDILVVEDIFDSGLTLSRLIEAINNRNPRSIGLCALLNKPERRRVDISLDYEGFIVPDEFVVGYGLDFNEKYRNLPFIGVLKPEIYQS